VCRVPGIRTRAALEACMSSRKDKTPREEHDYSGLITLIGPAVGTRQRRLRQSTENIARITLRARHAHAHTAPSSALAGH